MNPVTEHYDHHLGPVYAWMLGDESLALKAARADLRDEGLLGSTAALAVDLGAGPGYHAQVLAELGYAVVAVDSCRTLLESLAKRTSRYDVRPVLGDILSFRSHVTEPVDAVVCMGDTLTHLPSPASVKSLFANVATSLVETGIFIATFRDYASRPPDELERFVFVRGDEHRVLTCFLEYRERTVVVHDLLHEKKDGRWNFRIGRYPKLRLDPEWVGDALGSLGFSVRSQTLPSGMLRLVARLTDRAGGVSQS